MKSLLTLLLLYFSSPLFASSNKTFSVDSLQSNKNNSHLHSQDNWIAKDKGMHLVGSFIVSGATTLSLKRFRGYSGTKSLNIGVSFSFGLGIIKEIYDGKQENNKFSYKDLSADLIGSLLAYIVFK